MILGFVTEHFKSTSVVMISLSSNAPVELRIHSTFTQKHQIDENQVQSCKTILDYFSDLYTVWYLTGPAKLLFFQPGLEVCFIKCYKTWQEKRKKKNIHKMKEKKVKCTTYYYVGYSDALCSFECINVLFRYRTTKFIFDFLLHFLNISWWIFFFF